MTIYNIESVRLSHSADKKCFSITEKYTNKLLVYVTDKVTTKKLMEKTNIIFRLKGDEHIKALKEFLEVEFNIFTK